MWGLNEVKWLWPFVAMAFVGCGARTEIVDGSDFPVMAGASSSGTSGTGGTGGTGGEACTNDPPTGGCGGSGGALSDYARLHAPCGSAAVVVNRAGPPVPICHHIK